MGSCIVPGPFTAGPKLGGSEPDHSSLAGDRRDGDHDDDDDDDDGDGSNGIPTTTPISGSSPPRVSTHRKSIQKHPRSRTNPPHAMASRAAAAMVLAGALPVFPGRPLVAAGARCCDGGIRGRVSCSSHRRSDHPSCAAEVSTRWLLVSPHPNGFQSCSVRFSLIVWLSGLVQEGGVVELLKGAVAALAVIAQISVSLPADAILYSPDTNVPRTGELALRRAIPANPNMKTIQVNCIRIGGDAYRLVRLAGRCS